jgi:hypothetical protein
MADEKPLPVECQRLEEDAHREKNWKRWGPYLAERQWATVREDYSPDGSCWTYFPHDHARSRAYRWGEDGLLGICDRECRLCFSIALWNERDPILKERLFGLTGLEGNHGEDVKEQYFYLDSTPTHSYMKALYRYPQAEFPYARLVEENRRRTRNDPEFELMDTGTFDNDRFFDVQAEYAKAAPDDILIRIRLFNRGPDAANLHVLPTLWFRNSWSWGCLHDGCGPKPWVHDLGEGVVGADHSTLKRFLWATQPASDGSKPELLFTENETNLRHLFNVDSPSPYVKDAFHEYVIHGRVEAVNPARRGTKAAAYYRLTIPPRSDVEIQMRLFAEEEAPRRRFGAAFEGVFERRIHDAEAFYDTQLDPRLNPHERSVARQAYAGLLWSKQFYHYVVADWLDGDPAQPPPPESRKNGRNSDWRHLFSRDVLSVPDKWEFPWFASWDLAFHMIPLAHVDPQMAKDQLVLLLREWYMHASGQIPAYEFAFKDVNPPVHAWACWRVYKMTGPRGHRDRLFLERVFQKLLINFTWWVNRKDHSGHHIFSGGFLGLDNIGVFDRSAPLPDGGHLQQADGTAWMAFYCLTMLAMALELASVDPAYEDVASKFFEHFVAIADAINGLGGSGLWDEEDGFYYDRLQMNGQSLSLRMRSIVGLIPLLAVEVLDESLLTRLPRFQKRMRWFLENRRDLARFISYMEVSHGEGGLKYLLAIPSHDRLVRILRYVFDENEFLSPHGLRSLSRYYLERPWEHDFHGQHYRVQYEPAESTSGLFGGNSNWRGPVWFPLNFLLIESMERYHYFYGQDLQVEFPTGSGRRLTLLEIARELTGRLAGIFDSPCGAARNDRRFDSPLWRDYSLFYEYYHPEEGRGLGASHQTGWTALIAPLLCDLARPRPMPASARPPHAMEPAGLARLSP